MTKKDKELLLKDLCARLPYSVICEIELKPHKLKGINKHKKLWWFEFGGFRCLDGVKPYLRPISSMTKDEKEELVDFGLAYWDNGKYTDEDGNTIIYGGKNFQLLPDIETYDWLNKNHFDYRGLIEKGLAIAVTEENNPYASN